MNENLAVCVRNAFKTYGSRKNPIKVLNDLNMNVIKGTIYGLLGASGCGKTTLLSCIIGRRKLDEGKLWIFQKEPDTLNSGISGNVLGYMPQEIALYNEFTIKETVYYFGWIFNMSRREIEARLDFLLKFLELPNRDRYVKNLSGGQQRRVSLGVALLHDPELLILDEPTVGVDPLLRENIWKHLLEITKNGAKTIIITTHYIDEVQQAHTVGLMRHGELLAEESPEMLLRQYECQSLEEVFLELCQKQTDSARTPKLQVLTINQSDNNRSIEKLPKRKGSELNKMRALLHKNFLRLWRSIGMMLFIFALPVIQVIVFCLSVGSNPSGLHLGVVNEEIDTRKQTCDYKDGCHTQHLSCRFLATLNKDTFNFDYYTSMYRGIEDVQKGKIWAVLYFHKNFSESFTQRALTGYIKDYSLVFSEIQVFPDSSNHQIYMTLQRELTLTYSDFSRKLISQCNKNPRYAESPLSFKNPIHGHKRPSFTNFMAPGIILTSIFFLAVGLTAVTLISEKTGGLLDRTWVAGVTSSQILFSYIVSQFVVMCLQTFLVIVFMIYVFGVECKGSIFLMVILTILEGFCGMCFGFVISSICQNEREAIQLALGSFYPNLLLSGVVWPIEGMNWILKTIAQFLPLTLATTGLRTIMTRGWSLRHDQVLWGFASATLWILTFILISLVIIKARSL